MLQNDNWKQNQKPCQISSTVLSYQVGGDNESNVHRASIEEGDWVGEINSSSRRPFTNFEKGVRFQF